ISLLRSCSSTVSVFYAVSGGHDVAAGQITQMVRESNYAWHVGCWNKYMFGTEHEGFYNNPVWYTDGMYNATIGLQKHMAEAYGIAKDRNHIIGHREHLNGNWVNWVHANYSFSTTCNSHIDPGTYWDWTRLMNGIVGAPPATLRLDTFVKGTDTKLYGDTWNGASWTGFNWIDNGPMASDPAAVSWAANRIDVFWQGTD